MPLLSTHNKENNSALLVVDSPGEIIPQFDEEYCSKQYLDAVSHGIFTFNEETYQLGKSIHWLTNPSSDLEWHILLHKFYYMVGVARQFSLTGNTCWSDMFIQHLGSWIAQTPPDFIATNVTGRRVQNWCYAWVLFHKAKKAFSPEFTALLLESVRKQVNCIVANLAPSRNHRALELYAIFVASITFPQIPEAGAWLRFSTRHMQENICTDLLEDGVHCELATDYHQIVLRNYLLFYKLCLLNKVKVSGEINRRLVSALEYTMYIHRPDGLIPALSDSDSSSYLYLLKWGAELFDRPDFAFVASRGSKGTAPKLSSRVFPVSGYCVLRSPWESAEPYCKARYMVFDCGPIGAGNHGHIDGLSVELAASGRTLVVDPGRYTYNEAGSYNWRAHFRKTRSHNTVTVDDEDQAHYVQVGKRRKICTPFPECRLLHEDLNGRVPYLHGQILSDKYDAVHDRHIWFPDHAYWVIVDQLRAPSEHIYTQRFHLSPTESPLRQSQADEHHCVYNSPNLTTVFFASRHEVSIETGFVSKTYGQKKASEVLTVSRKSTDTCFVTFFIPKTISARIQIDSKQLKFQSEQKSEPHNWSWDENSKTLRLSIHDAIRSFQFEHGTNYED